MSIIDGHESWVFLADDTASVLQDPEIIVCLQMLTPALMHDCELLICLYFRGMHGLLSHGLHPHVLKIGVVKYRVRSRTSKTQGASTLLLLPGTIWLYDETLILCRHDFQLRLIY